MFPPETVPFAHLHSQVVDNKPLVVITPKNADQYRIIKQSPISWINSIVVWVIIWRVRNVLMLMVLRNCSPDSEVACINCMNAKLPEVQHCAWDGVKYSIYTKKNLRISSKHCLLISSNHGLLIPVIHIILVFHIMIKQMWKIVKKKIVIVVKYFCWIHKAD